MKKNNNITDAEMLVINTMLKGYITNKTIAIKLNISYRTVEKHFSNIIKKTGLHDKQSIFKHFQQIKHKEKLQKIQKIIYS